MEDDVCQQNVIMLLNVITNCQCKNDIGTLNNNLLLTLSHKHCHWQPDYGKLNSLKAFAEICIPYVSPVDKGKYGQDTHPCIYT